MTSDNRWLVCHSLKEGQSGMADRWAAQLRAQVAAAGRQDEFILGKDDFNRCKKPMGRSIWSKWPGTRATDVLGGRDRFTRALVPVSSLNQAIGKGTWAILEGFFEAGKPVYAWLYKEGRYVKVTGQERNEAEFEDRKEVFRQYGFLVCESE